MDFQTILFRVIFEKTVIYQYDIWTTLLLTRNG